MHALSIEQQRIKYKTYTVLWQSEARNDLLKLQISSFMGPNILWGFMRISWWVLPYKRISTIWNIPRLSYFIIDTDM